MVSTLGSLFFKQEKLLVIEVEKLLALDDDLVRSSILINYQNVKSENPNKQNI